MHAVREVPEDSIGWPSSGPHDTIGAILQPAVVGDEDFETLKQHGFDDDDIWDIAGITAIFGLSNRMANVTSMRPNAEFYSMGRNPGVGDEPA